MDRWLNSNHINHYSKNTKSENNPNEDPKYCTCKDHWVNSIQEQQKKIKVNLCWNVSKRQWMIGFTRLYLNHWIYWLRRVQLKMSEVDKLIGFQFSELRHRISQHKCTKLEDFRMILNVMVRRKWYKNSHPLSHVYFEKNKKNLARNSIDLCAVGCEMNTKHRFS